MSAPTRVCAVHGCLVHHDRDKLLCTRHWFQVPKPLRDEIWRAHRLKDGAAWHAAAMQAIRIVNAKEQETQHASA